MSEADKYGVREGNKLKIGAFPGQSKLYNIIFFDKEEGVVNFSKNITTIKQICGINKIEVHRNHVDRVYGSTEFSSIMKYNQLHQADEAMTYDTDVCIILDDTYPDTSIASIIPKTPFISIAEIGARFGANSDFILKSIGTRVNRYDIFENRKIMVPVLKKLVKDRKNVTIIDNTDLVNVLSQSNRFYDFILFNTNQSYNTDENLLKEIIKHLYSYSTICFLNYDSADVEMLITDYEDKILGRIYALDKEKGAIIKIRT